MCTKIELNQRVELIKKISQEILEKKQKSQEKKTKELKYLNFAKNEKEVGLLMKAREYARSNYKSKTSKDTNIDNDLLDELTLAFFETIKLSKKDYSNISNKYSEKKYLKKNDKIDCTSTLMQKTLKPVKSYKNIWSEIVLDEFNNMNLKAYNACSNEYKKYEFKNKKIVDEILKLTGNI